MSELKKKVCDANCALPRHGLVKLTWGNVSGIDRESGIVIIKPSGVSYDSLTPEDMVAINMDGRVLSANMKPSSDTPTHLRLYQAFPIIGGIVHTHATHCTAFAQAGLGIPVFGTTHADHFYGEIPCTRALTDMETGGDYERETGGVIVETFLANKLNPLTMPGILVSSHGMFAFGRSAAEALHNAVAMEEIAAMAFFSLSLKPCLPPVSQALLDKHFKRKHGPDAYYGQT